jgi:predicted enzyme related to lactoylglutathione lyase
VSAPEVPPVGAVAWVDLTVEDATGVRDVYAAVAGWPPSAVDMGDYADYAMGPADGDPVAGICHARGANVGLPAQWLVYVTVADLDRSLGQCTALGGTVVTPPRDMGAYGRFAVVRDPAGAVLALIQRPPA